MPAKSNLIVMPSRHSPVSLPLVTQQQLETLSNLQNGVLMSAQIYIDAVRRILNAVHDGAEVEPGSLNITREIQIHSFGRWKGTGGE